jgi:hypothetical protein
MTYVSKRAPRMKQAEAIEFLRGKPVAALLMAMRTGKTKVIVDDWGSNPYLDNLLVIAPAGAYMPWADGVYLDYPMNDVEVFTYVSKTRKKDAERLGAFMRHPGRRVLLINIEAISAVEDARNLALDFLSEGLSMLVIDESVIIKNGDSKCSEFIVDKLSPLAAYKRIQTGLVSPQSPLDVYHQFRFLDPQIFPEKFTDFRERYAIIRRICKLPTNIIRNKFESVFGLRNKNLSPERLQWVAKTCWPEGNVPAHMVYGFASMMTRDDMVAAIFRAGRWIESVPVIEGYRRVDEIHERIKPYSYRVRLEDCYDMPANDYSFRDVEMTKEQERIYAEMKLFATAQLEKEKHVTATNVITQILRLHQILCGHTMDEEGNPAEIPEKRTDAVVELLQDYDGKAIIWCSYDADVRKVTAALEKEFGKGTVARFWGGNRDTREQEEIQFKTDPYCRFMIATPDAGGRGRTWDCADLVIYHSSRNNLDHRAQSEERAKNVGKSRPVAYVDMRVPGTVEEKIIDALRRKQNLADIISGDDFRDWLV